MDQSQSTTKRYIKSNLDKTIHYNLLLQTINMDIAKVKGSSSAACSTSKEQVEIPRFRQPQFKRRSGSDDKHIPAKRPRINDDYQHGIHLGKLMFLAKSEDGFYSIRQYRDTETSLFYSIRQYRDTKTCLVPTRKGVCMDKSQWMKIRDVKSKLQLGGSLYQSPSVNKGETSMHIREFLLVNNKLAQQLYGITLSADSGNFY